MTDDPYTLYYDVQTSAFIPHVMLEELGVPYRLHHIDTTVGAHREAEYRAINPNMLVPALGLPDGRVFGENGAILTALGDRHPDAGMVPTIGDHDRPHFLQWLFALATTGHTTMRRYSYMEEYTTSPDGFEGVHAAANNQLQRFLTIVDGVIAGDPWFLPRGFGPLDIYLTMLLLVYSEEQLAALFEELPSLGRLHEASHKRRTVRDLWQFYFTQDG